MTLTRVEPVDVNEDEVFQNILGGVLGAAWVLVKRGHDSRVGYEVAWNAGVLKPWEAVLGSRARGFRE